MGGTSAEITFSDVMLAKVCFLNETNVKMPTEIEFVEVWLFVLIHGLLIVDLNKDGRNTCLYKFG